MSRLVNTQTEQESKPAPEPASKPAPKPAVGVICFRGDDVLLIKRGTAPAKGEWLIPGGRPETDEAYEKTALRELYEETGVRARLIEKIAVIDADFGATEPGSFHYILHDYLAVYESGGVRAGDDAAHAQFVSPEALTDLAVWDTLRELIEIARHRLKALNI